MKTIKIYFIVSLILLAISVIFFIEAVDLESIFYYNDNDQVMLLSSTILLISSAFIFLKGIEKTK